ncbi:nicotinate phosphoribosyltransferase [candidate division MSBL1 archaeon SCGC-AAA382A13]|uniref:nicotinate phosphoribosyltransferase n=1 Tax=candidate division MSBL1 archaeon SCGC-AAA382A13 TaxID=1698279 RepID=A0A133VDT2_9EURY|nr:nicotinate phosphoribosyltransferase [candidate division MSBL1 archaeon SCGC-AAA382A13]
MNDFHIASDEDIKSGKTTDVYFARTEKILEAEGKSNIEVVAEITSSSLPQDWEWAVLSGVDEVAKLFEDVPVNVWTLPEGTIFKPYDINGIRVPLLIIEGPYGSFSALETPMLGFLCHASGVTTKSARVRKAAGDKNILAFGIRRMHPAMAPMLDRAAYIGGLDGVSSLAGAEEIGKEPMGTMPHALIIVMGGQVKAWKAFDKHISKDVPRVALVDTYSDEKEEAIKAAEALQENLDGVRLDTPGSRKGDFASLIREVRWELDARGFDHVDIVVSGGLDEYTIPSLVEAGAESFGVGTSVTNAPVLNLAMDIVEVKGKLSAKRGKLSGKKEVWKCSNCYTSLVSLKGKKEPECPKCGGKMKSGLELLVKDGEIVRDAFSPEEIRGKVLDQLDHFEINLEE